MRRQAAGTSMRLPRDSPEEDGLAVKTDTAGSLLDNPVSPCQKGRTGLPLPHGLPTAPEDSPARKTGHHCASTGSTDPGTKGRSLAAP